MSIWSLRAVGGPARPFDEAEAARALAVLCDPAAWQQVQALPCAKWRQMPADDAAALAAAASDLAARTGQSVYYLLNPIPRGLGRPARNQDALARWWLLIDVDRRKGEADKGLSATDAEKEASRAVAEAVRAHLDGLGWPAPVVIDSGNGWHLLYRIDLPNDALSAALLKAVLGALADRFDTAAAQIDRAMHDAKRCAKLPGCWAVRGPDTPERPHRPCRLLSAPEAPEAVPVALLQALAQPGTPQAEAPAPSPWHVRAGGDGGEAWARAALEREAAAVALAAPGERNKRLNKAAYSLGGYVAAGLLDRGEVERVLTLMAERSGLAADTGCGPEGIAATIKSGIDKGMLAPRQAPGRNGRAAAAGADDDGAPRWRLLAGEDVVAEGLEADLFAAALPASPPLRTYEMLTMRQLLVRDIPEPQWVVPGILSEGLNILAGKPKQGKSMLALNMAVTIAAGGKALKSVQVPAGDVLYLSLEDKQRRVQFRARKIVSGLGESCISDRLTVATAWPRQHAGGLALMDHWFGRALRPALVIIDVWGMFKPPGEARGSAYEQDYRHLGEVKACLDEHGCSGLVLMHCRKAAAEDALEEVSGTMGLTGVADGVLVLSRERSDNEAKVFITGRDVQEQELALRFDPATLTWESLGPAEQHLTGKLQAAIVGYLRGLNGGSAFAQQIADALSEDEVRKVRVVLTRLEARRIVRRVGNAWSYPGEDTPAVDGPPPF